MKSNKLLRPEEVADLLGLRLPTIRRMILLRKIPLVKIGRSVRVPQEVVNEIIEKGWKEPL